MLHLRLQHLDALLLINVFVNKITCPSILNTAGLGVPSKIIRDHSIFTASYCAKASPSATCVTVANVVCSKIAIFNQHSILLKKLIRPNTIWFKYYCIPTSTPTVHTIICCLILLFINFLLSIKWPGIILQFCNFLLLYFVLYLLLYLLSVTFSHACILVTSSCSSNGPMGCWSSM